VLLPLIWGRLNKVTMLRMQEVESQLSSFAFSLIQYIKFGYIKCQLARLLVGF